MPHSPTARRAAAAMPLVLFGEYGRTIEGYRPADEDLAMARPAPGHHRGEIVAGPHLYCAPRTHARNKTGIIGISIGRYSRTGRHYLYVALGSGHRKFCVETLGSSEAWRRAIALRRAHLEKLALANAAIIAARERNSKGAAA
jgi:hypothetical protein